MTITITALGSRGDVQPIIQAPSSAPAQCMVALVLTSMHSPGSATAAARNPCCDAGFPTRGCPSAALRAGVLPIAVPFFLDQPFWAARVQAPGVGPDPTPLRKLDTDRLATVIRRALTDSAMRARSARLGELLNPKRGVESGVTLIEAAMMGAA
ncbi:MAG: hypothetical protein ABIV10_04200 [Gemmatimonadaceae bacterium]